MNATDRECLTNLLTLLETHPREMTLAQLVEAREKSGLSMGQAANYLRVTRHELERIEKSSAGDHYWAARREMVADRMAKTYCCARSAT